jgi:hypothetical protein
MGYYLFMLIEIKNKKFNYYDAESSTLSAQRLVILGWRKKPALLF